ncbi:TetR family transcriptional regulator [Cupriavidus necator]|uniref:TetR/AcrR family transcriptional regulator n=1 Tax=Cupriavidus necator TaxID=106590 RepID=UPI000735387A|nr:TetR/AcrR family transcriptional regulator [Cupriavidus necator]KUE84815.1 TetR family transcriptional regulator [Cupriavidus necator]
MATPSRRRPGGHDILHIEVPARPRKRPRQQRSVKLVEALVTAGWEILEKEGRAALSLEHVSDRSGVAVSSIYEYFPTMESLMGAIFVDYRLQARRRLLEDLRALPPESSLFDGILLILRHGIVFLNTWAGIDRDFFMRSAHYEELVRLDMVKSENNWTSVVTDALMEKFSGEIVVTNRQRARFLTFQTLLALPRAMTLMQPALLNEPDTPLLLARMVQALLTTPDHLQ